jgi:fibronectin type 3 domain-containing protein
MAHKVTLTWNPPVTGDPAQSYNIKRSTVQTGPFTSIGTSVTPTFEDDNVVAGTTYYYEVDSVNTAGESGPSNEVTAIVPFLVPGPPVNLAAIAV